MFSIVLILLIFGISNNARSQTPEDGPPNEVFVQSWKKGNASISDIKFTVDLSSNQRKFRKVIVSGSGKKFVLRFDYKPFKDLDLEYWQAVLFDESDKTKADLLSTDKNETGKHYFPKEDFVGFFYPRTKAIVFSEKNEPMFGDSYDFYYIGTTRKIQVENFILIISLLDLKMNSDDPDRVDLMSLSVEFKPSPES